MLLSFVFVLLVWLVGWLGFCLACCLFVTFACVGQHIKYTRKGKS